MRRQTTWRTRFHHDGSATGKLRRAAMVFLITAACFPGSSYAQETGQKRFASPEAAVTALVTATRNNDQPALLQILGARARRLISSGDSAEDTQDRASFVMRFDQMHRLVTEPDGATTLYIGAANWPMPIPLVRTGDQWYFDTATAKREILFRRIGRNELSAIRVCEELVAAEREYHATRPDTYARRIFSAEGTRDGLYWNAADGETKSPIGPLVARAVATGDASEHHSNVTPIPYRGYYFHILTSQGGHAPGGSHSFDTSGKLTSFAFVAYPAEYRSSGVMSFIVGEDGVVLQKDLGRSTNQVAKAMSAYDPDPSWKKAEEEAQAAPGTAQH